MIICMVNFPNLFSLKEQLCLPSPPTRPVLSKIGCRNFFAISPAVKQMQHRLPHTQLSGGRLLADAIEHRICGLLHQLVSVTHFLNVYSIKCTSAESPRQCSHVELDSGSRPNCLVIAYYCRHHCWQYFPYYFQWCTQIWIIERNNLGSQLHSITIYCLTTE